MTLDPAGLEAAAKALHMWEHGDPTDYAEPDYRECVEVAVRAYLAAAVPPTAENSAERDHIRRALQKLHDTGLLDVGTATGVALAAAQHAAVAAGRAAADRNTEGVWPDQSAAHGVLLDQIKDAYAEGIADTLDRLRVRAAEMLPEVARFTLDEIEVAAADLADWSGHTPAEELAVSPTVSYRVRDRDSDYKAMCHEDRDHAELLLKAWLADGRDAVIERRHVFDGGWLPVGRPFFTGQQERMLDRCEAFDAANPEPETDT